MTGWLAVAALALLFRIWLSCSTPVPAEDGANYLWMAERFAEGDFVAPIGEVFPPLGAMLAAVPIACGAPPVAATQGLMALAGALSVVTVGRAAGQGLGGGELGRRVGLTAAWILCWSPLAARFGAEGYSEPLFVCVVGVALDAGFRRRPWCCGFWSAVGFWVRPEALVVPLGFALASVRRRTPPFAAGWWALVPLALGILLLTLWRGAATGDFHPLPKLAFNAARGLDESGRWLHNLSRVPLAALEAYGPALLLVPFAWRWPTSSPGRERAVGVRRDCLWVWGLALVPIVTFAVRRRFFVSWSGVAAVLAALGALAIAAQMRRRTVVLAALGWALYGSLVAWRGLIDESRLAERDLGRWLAAQTEPGQRIAGDMTRVLYFAGQRPLPPMHFDAAELIERARAPGVAWAVFSAARPTWGEVRAGLPEWGPAALPARLREAVDARRMVVLAAPGHGR